MGDQRSPIQFSPVKSDLTAKDYLQAFISFHCDHSPVNSGLPGSLFWVQ